jgi:hypothetical protein
MNAAEKPDRNLVSGEVREHVGKAYAVGVDDECHWPALSVTCQAE